MRPISKAEAQQLLLAETAALPAAAGGCALCGLVLEPGRRAQQVAESAAGVVVIDQYARRRGHLLVVLREHLEQVAALPWEHYIALQRLVWDATQALTQVLAPRRIYVATLGAQAAPPTSFPHLHVHVVPLFHGDERDRPASVFTFVGGVLRYEDGEAEQLAQALRAAWPPPAA